MRIVSRDPEFRYCLDLCGRIAPERKPVVLVGETGSGKSFLARFIHQKSGSAEEPFISWRATDVPESLIEAEVLGVEKGVATGVLPRSGLLEAAGGGTLSISGLEDVPFKTQALFLRVLEQGEYEKVGGHRRHRFSGRILAEFDTDPEALVREKKLRADLLYRLNVFQIDIPPLRDRKRDIVPLLRSFVREEARKAGSELPGISQELEDAVMKYRWPGNLREMRNACAYLVARGDNPLLPEHLPANVVLSAADPVGSAIGARMSLKELKDAYIRSVLVRVRGNRTEASKWLGISRKNLWEHLKEK